MKNNRRQYTLAIAVCAVTLAASASAGSSAYAKTAKKPAKPAAAKKTTAKPTATTKAGASSSAGGTKLTIPASEVLKRDVIITVPAGTKAKPVKDSPATLLTFPDGGQMSVYPDAPNFADYKATIVKDEEQFKTPAANRAKFLESEADHLVYIDNTTGTPAIHLIAQKLLPDLVVEKVLATGMVCDNSGRNFEVPAPSQASADVMVAACLSIVSA